MALGERLAFLVTADGAQAIGEFGRVAAAAKAAGVEAQGAGEGLGGIGKAAAIAGIGVAAAAIGKFAEDSIKHYLDATDAVLQFQRVAGGTAQEASTLVDVFHVLGIDTDAAATGMFRLGKEADTGGAKLATVGISVAKTNSGTVDLIGTLGNVVDAYQKAGSAAERDTILFDAFGRGGQALMPMLSQNRQALADLFAEAQAHGEIFTQDQLDQAEQFKIKVHELGVEFKAFEDVIGAKLVSVISGAISTVERYAVAFHLLSQSTVDAANAAADATDKLNAEAAAADAAATDAQTFRDALLEVESANKAVAAAEDAVAKAREASAQKTEDITRATQQYDDAVRSVTTAQNALAEAEAMAIEKPLRDMLSLHSATYAVADAQKAYNQAVEEYGRNSEEAAKAADGVTTAQLNQKDAQRHAAQPDTSVDQAKANLAKANDAVAKAQQAINTAEAEDPAKTLATAQENLAIAVGHQADAQGRAKTAADKSKSSNDQLKSGFDAFIGDLKAAGVDPATIAVFQHIEDAAIAARTQVQGLGSDTNGLPGLDGSGKPAPAKPKKHKSLWDRVNDAANEVLSGQAHDDFYHGLHTIGGDVSDYFSGTPNANIDGTAAKGGTTNNIQVNVQTNADPNAIAGQIVYSMTSRAQ